MNLNIVTRTSSCRIVLRTNRPHHGPLKNAELMTEGEDLKLKRRTTPA